MTHAGTSSSPTRRQPPGTANPGRAAFLTSGLQPEGPPSGDPRPQPARRAHRL